MSEPRPPPTFGRSVGVAVALVVALGLGAALLFERCVGGPTPEPAPAAPAPAAAAPARPESAEALVTAVQGQVEVSPAGGSSWRQLRAGDRLTVAESLRTGAAARADLQVGGEDSRLTVTEGTELTVRELTRAAHAFRLKRGRLRVDYAPDGARVLRVETEDGAVAETRGARFTVLRSGATVAVATEAGTVDLAAGGAHVTLGAGEQAVSADGEAPEAPRPIPLDVLLRVARLAREGSGACVVAEGTVRPGTEVWADERPVPVGRDGRFRLEVPRRAGLARVRVRAREPGGLERVEDVPCRPEDRPAKADVRFRWE